MKRKKVVISTLVVSILSLSAVFSALSPVVYAQEGISVETNTNKQDESNIVIDQEQPTVEENSTVVEETDQMHNNKDIKEEILETNQKETDLTEITEKIFPQKL